MGLFQVGISRTEPSLSQLLFKSSKCCLNVLYAEVLLTGGLALYRSIKFEFYFLVLITVPCYTGTTLVSLLKTPWDNFLYNILTLSQADNSSLMGNSFFLRNVSCQCL